MSAIKEYKCPACGGTMEFDSTSQKMKCPYCDTEISVEEYEALNESQTSEDKKSGQTEKARKKALLLHISVNPVEEGLRPIRRPEQQPVRSAGTVLY